MAFAHEYEKEWCCNRKQLDLFGAQYCYIPVSYSKPPKSKKKKNTNALLLLRHDHSLLC